ncbi:hypothetical protein Bsp3421_005037 [Burkholderia sp. FERM BP-3421]|uniref:hypothetical protein n=1 Tax=Burkholderia sp. FERM BP-3421 TaxID=1494466 RepID=UPI0023625063|nr:hypothetical protein [Burkholderia sp. FERM BP-3421]WDD94890.1 hypothetical protein Bsp3421_005037 [Burkholderia sp. FERM BP-3421]
MFRLFAILSAGALLAGCVAVPDGGYGYAQPYYPGGYAYAPGYGPGYAPVYGTINVWGGGGGDWRGHRGWRGDGGWHGGRGDGGRGTWQGGGRGGHGGGGRH